MAKPVSRRHHYTPRYYLKRFENATGALWRFDPASGAVVRGNNQRFGYKNNWNTLSNPPTGYAPDWAEQRIAEIDGLAAAEIARILAGDFPAHLRALACAIAFMTHNNPRVMQALDEEHADEVGKWSEDHRLMVKLHASLQSWQDYLPTYYAVQVIDGSDQEARFLTSSNPVIDMSNLPTMFLPISSRHCLFLSRDPQHRTFTPRFTTCDRAMVAELNNLTIKNSWQYLYSSTPSFDP